MKFINPLYWFKQTLEFIFYLADKVGPIKKKMSENTTFVIGVIFGGIGLAIYLRCAIDLVIPLILAVSLGAILFPIMGHFVQLVGDILEY